MNIIIVTDIFGKTVYTDNLSLLLQLRDAFTVTVDPYQGGYRNFIDEKEAYAAFISECGHDEYARILEQSMARMEKSPDADFKGKNFFSVNKNESSNASILISFSAGASAAWIAAAGVYGNSIRHLIGFYPTQIRNHLDITPQCPTTLLFPMVEGHFDVNELIQKLSEKKNTICIKTNFMHGFMNPLSKNFSQKAYTFFLSIIRSVERFDDAAPLMQLLRNYADNY